MKLYCILAFTLLLPGLSAQAPVEKAKPARLEGTVFAADSGQPLNKAVVRLFSSSDIARRPEPPRQVRTDSSGRFVFEEVEPGRYSLQAARSGYAEQAYGGRPGRGRGSAITVEAGQRVRDLDFRLVPAGVIAGRVVDEDGEPAVNAMVTVHLRIYRQGRRQLAPATITRTDDKGEFRAFGLAPGTYYLSATESFGPGTSVMAGTFVIGAGGRSGGAGAPVFYPGVFEEQYAAALRLRPGDELRADLRLITERAGRIRGRVVNSVKPNAVSGTMIFLVRSGSVPMAPPVPLRPDGTFEIDGVMPGSYSLVAAWREEQNLYTARQALEMAGDDVDDVTLVLAPGTRVAGRVRVEGRQEERDVSELRVVFMTGEMLPFAQRQAPVAADGGFTLENVPEGAYRLQVGGLWPDAYLKSVRYGEREVTAQEIHVGGQAGRMEVTVSANGGRVEGTALNRSQLPAPGATVVLVPRDERAREAQLFKVGGTDQHGRFVLRGVPPGEYRLLAWEDVEMGAWTDPEFLDPLENEGVPVRIAEGQQSTADVRALPAPDDSLGGGF